MSEGHRARRGVLLIGKSQRVLGDAGDHLRRLGYEVGATNDFDHVTQRFDAVELDVVVLGGQVPPDRKAELRAELGALNPRLIFVEGLAGIPGLIVDQVEEAFADSTDVLGQQTYDPGRRRLELRLSEAANVRVTAWWQTTFVPPDPESDSLILLDERLDAGDHAIAIPERVPMRSAFASVRAGSDVSAFSISA